MAVSKDNTRITFTVRKSNIKALDHIANKLGITRSSVINLALYDLIQKHFASDIEIVEGDMDATYDEIMNRIEK